MLALKQSSAPRWGSSCSALVTVYTTSPKVFRKQIILEPLPPIQMQALLVPFSLFFPVLFVFGHEFQQSVYVVCARACACMCACVCFPMQPH